MKLTSEQEAIISEASSKSNLQIISFAGTGKTTAIQLLDRAMPVQPRLYLAFNKRIVDEIVKHEKLRPTTECRTLNSLGHRVWGNVVPSRLKLDPKKCYNIFKEVVKDFPKDTADELWEISQEILEAVGLAKALGYIPEGCVKWENRLLSRQTFFASLETPLTDFASRVVDHILSSSITAAYNGLIDFNDQLYMPALFGGTFPRYPTVLIDEAQDLSPVNHEMIVKLAKYSRVISVGDPFQSIYQFRGAMQDGMLRQRSAFSMGTRELSVSFRCAKAIVEHARWRVPGFQWIRDGGSVEVLKTLDLRGVPDESAFICRNNAPLFRLALNLLSARRSVSMAGTDIGPRLINILRRFGDESLPRSAVLSSIDDWEAARPESKTAGDMAECLRLFANLTKDLGGAIAYAQHILNQEGTIHLTTGHKSKGLEWEAVYHLDPWLLAADEQDLNLRYVIQTRAKDAYFEIETDGIEAP